MVKTALEPTKKALRRERNNYLIPGIRSSPYIRSQYDIIDRDPGSNKKLFVADETATAPDGMVFEWMEYDLWQVPSERFRQNSVLPKVISKSVLSALALLSPQDSVRRNTYGSVSNPFVPEQLLIYQISIQTTFSFLILTVLLRLSR